MLHTFVTRLLQSNYIFYTIAFLFDVFFINVLFNYISTNFFIVITSLLITLFTYKLFMFIFKLAFLNTHTTEATIQNTNSITDTIKDANRNIIYLSNFLFENDFLYRLLTEKKFNKSEIAMSEQQFENEVKKFVGRFSQNFIQSWYYPYISQNNEFINESKIQLEYLLMDVFKRFLRINKLELFKNFAFIFTENYLNIATVNVSNRALLHDALQSPPKSEINYMKNCVQLILLKSLCNSYTIKDGFINELFLQIIGKNCLEQTIDLITQPNFIYYSIILLCDQKYEFKKTSDSSANRDRATEANSVNTNAAPVMDTLQVIPELHRKLSNDQQSKLTRQSKFDLSVISDEKVFDIENDDNNRDSSSFQSMLFDFKLNLDDGDKSSATPVDGLLRVSETDSDGGNMTHNEETQSNENLPIKESDNENAIKDLNSNLEIISLNILSTITDYDSKTGNPFTLFNIQFTSKFTNKENQEETKTKTLRRRHKQFVNLHKRLEENPDLKGYVKHIKGPSTLFSLPIGNMDEQYIQKRKDKLNAYLNNLIKIPEIRCSTEFKAFFSFDESNILDHKNSNDENKKHTSNTIDKLLIRTVSGMFDKITSTTSALAGMRQKSDDSNANQSTHNSAKQNSLLEFGKLNLKYECFNSTSYIECFAKATKYLNRFNQMNTLHVNQNEKQNDETKESSVNNELPALSKILLECFIKLTLISSSNTDGYLNNERLYQLLCAISSRYYVERYLTDLLNELFNEKSLSEYLHKLEKVLFEKDNDDDDIDFKKFNLDLQQFALKTVENIIPNQIRILIGKSRLNQTLKVFFDALKDPILNRHFVYCLLDITLYNLYKDTA